MSCFKGWQFSHVRSGCARPQKAEDDLPLYSAIGLGRTGSEDSGYVRTSTTAKHRDQDHSNSALGRYDREETCSDSQHPDI